MTEAQEALTDGMSHTDGPREDGGASRLGRPRQRPGQHQLSDRVTMFQHTHTHELESHDERRIGNRNPGESMWKKPSDEGFILADIPGVWAWRRRYRAAVAPFAERLAAGAKAGSTPAGDRGKGGENR